MKATDFERPKHGAVGSVFRAIRQEDTLIAQCRTDLRRELTE
jgi:hypothetical protein